MFVARLSRLNQSPVLGCLQFACQRYGAVKLNNKSVRVKGGMNLRNCIIMRNEIYAE